MAAPTRADRQTTIRLPSAYYDLLADAADLSGTSVGEEIRRRLMETFGPISEPHIDEKTRELLNLTAVMAQEVEEYLPPWHQDPGSYLVFVTALTEWLQQYKLEGDAALKPKPTAERLFGRRAPIRPPPDYLRSPLASGRTPAAHRLESADSPHA